MKSLLFALLLMPMSSYALDMSFSCKSTGTFGAWDFFVVDLNSRTIERLNLYRNKVTSKGIIADQISFKTEVANTGRHLGKTLKIVNSEGALIFVIEDVESFGLVGTRFYNPGEPYVEAHMPCIVGRGLPPDDLPGLQR